MTLEDVLRILTDELRAVMSNMSPYDVVAKGASWADGELTRAMEKALVSDDIIYVNDRVYDFTFNTLDVDINNCSFSGVVSFVLYKTDQGLDKVKKSYEYVRAPSANIIMAAEESTSDEIKTRQEAGQCIICGDDGEWRSLQLTCRNGHGRICG